MPVRTRLPHGTRVLSRWPCEARAWAKMTKGKILAWVRNDHGQLGNGSTARRSRTPVRVKLRRKATAISAGCTYGLARTARGRVLAWGDNFSGELGNGTTKDSRTPVRVHLPAAAVAIGSGPDAFTSLAIIARGGSHDPGGKRRGRAPMRAALAVAGAVRRRSTRCRGAARGGDSDR